MGHENEYHDNMVKMLELIWGDGYMAPGGPGNVAKLLQGTEPKGKRVLDIGCGIGGPAIEMVRTHGATVTGIDLEAPLIARARTSADAAGVQSQCSFQQVDPGPLSFADNSFDIIVSSGAVTQTPDKATLFAEIFRVLRRGGFFTCYEWMTSGERESDEMRYWVKLEGLTYDFETLADYNRRLLNAGFEDVVTEDASDWYRAEARREYEQLRGDLYESLVSLLGQEDANYFVEDWRAMCVVCDSGEMRQAYSRGRKHA